MMDFQYTKTIAMTFEEAMTKLKDSLKAQGMGVLWEMDVPSKLKDKGQDFGTPLRIFEVCNPVKAKKVLETNIMASYFLPCKVVAYHTDGKTSIGMVRPSTLIGVLGEERLHAMADEVEQELKAAIDGVQ